MCIFQRQTRESLLAEQNDGTNVSCEHCNCYQLGDSWKQLHIYYDL